MFIQCITVHYSALQCITVHYSALQCITVHRKWPYVLYVAQIRSAGTCGHPEPGDITGVVFEVDPAGSQAVQRLILSDGNGRSAKPFKSEWATVKDTLWHILILRIFASNSDCKPCDPMVIYAILWVCIIICHRTHCNIIMSVSSDPIRSWDMWAVSGAPTQDGFLIVGSMGREWVGDDGRIQHYNPQWVKQIDRNWHVESLDWRKTFEAMRATVGVRSPGYLWHEAIIWDSLLKRWIVLPRKASLEAYSPVADETRGTNLLLLATEDFSIIDQLRIGPLEPDWGFAAVRKVPGTNDTFAALKVLEVGSRTATKICVFDLKGNMLLEPAFQEVDEQKFEGLEFTDELQWPSRPHRWKANWKRRAFPALPVHGHLAPNITSSNFKKGSIRWVNIALWLDPLLGFMN